MPTARGELGPSAVVDGKIYVIGGDQNIHANRSTLGSPIVEEYDPSTDTWTRKANMPTSRVLPGTCAVGGKVYAIGGLSSNGETVLSVVEQYNPATDTWTRKANMPTGVWCLCARVVNGKIYTVGGRLGSTAVPNTYEYDPTADTWTRKADMSVATNQIASGVIGNKIIVVGGWLWSYSYPYTTVQVYDPETDIWTRETDAPFLRACVAGEVVNNRLYVIGGTDRPHPCVALSTVFEFGPLADFNADEIVNIQDLLRLIESWGKDDPAVDMAPMPWGDGMVDARDLEVLMSYWQQEVLPASLMAYWKLDEAEGTIAADKVGTNDGTLVGSPVWQPAGGKLGGALLFDGVDDYVDTPFVLNPADGPLSVFAWVKEGAPGQAILSQAGGANWLMAAAPDGALMTELKGAGRTAPFVSPVSITDDMWHRVGLTWDGISRVLYVDGVEVARGTQGQLASSTGGLYIGTGSTMTPTSFWQGLIDDVRIYDRVAKP
jgi:hypothetical protein